MFSLLVRRLGEIVEEGHGDRAAECSKSKRRAALLIGDSCEPHFDQWCSDAEGKARERTRQKSSQNDPELLKHSLNGILQ